jgi:hypothetical protein
LFGPDVGSKPEEETLSAEQVFGSSTAATEKPAEAKEDD